MQKSVIKNILFGYQLYFKYSHFSIQCMFILTVHRLKVPFDFNQTLIAAPMHEQRIIDSAP